MRGEMWRATGNDRSNFNLIGVVQHLIFGDEVVALDDQMCFDDEVQLSQEIFDLLGAFDFDCSCWMAELDLHGGIIGWAMGTRQGASLAGC